MLHPTQVAKWHDLVQPLVQGPQVTFVQPQVPVQPQVKVQPHPVSVHSNVQG